MKRPIQAPRERPAPAATIPLVPSQLELSMGEKCNLACDYCFVDKSSPFNARWEAVERAIAWFFSLPPRRVTVTFTTMEPFLRTEAWKAAVTMILSEADRTGCQGNIITTTNGLRLDDDILRFIDATDQRLWMNVSLDGGPASHDAHRRLNAGGGAPSEEGSFDAAFSRIRRLPRHRTRVICTLTPDAVPRLSENLDFFLAEGFRYLDLYPNILTVWPADALESARRQIESFVERINGMEEPVDFRLLNRLWGPPYNDKILFSADERFYAYEGVLMVPYERRERWRVSRRGGKPDLEKRRVQMEALFDEFASRTGDACARCELKAMCGYPTPLMLWCDAKGFDLAPYYDSFTRVAKTFVALARGVRPRNRPWTDQRRFDRLEPAAAAPRPGGAAG